MASQFSTVISQLRKRKGLSQKQVASDLGVSQSLLSHYEKGVRECGNDFVVKVADYYGVSCDFLLGRCSREENELILLMNDKKMCETEVDVNTMTKAYVEMMNSVLSVESEKAEVFQNYLAMCMYRAMCAAAKTGYIPQEWIGEKNESYLSVVSSLIDGMFTQVENKPPMNDVECPESIAAVRSSCESYIRNELNKAINSFGL